MTYLKHPYLLAYLWATFLAISFAFGYTPILISCIYIFASAFIYLLYLIDKSAAISSGWRGSEVTLHLGSLLCGWPGALIAQDQLSHKTTKKEFQRVFWITVASNCGVIFWLHTDECLRFLYN